MAHWAIDFILQNALLAIRTAIIDNGRLSLLPAGPGSSRNRGVCRYSYHLPLPTAELSDNWRPGHLLLQYSWRPATPNSILGYKAGYGSGGFVDDPWLMVSLFLKAPYRFQYTDGIKA